MADNLTDPNINRNEHDDTGGVLGKRVKTYVWNSSTLAWEKATQASGGGGGSGDGAILDGVNSAIKATVLDIGTQLTTNDNGLVTNTVMHGLTTAGGGGYVDVKVTPSGALTTADTIADGDDVATGATADAANTTGTTGTISGKLRGIVQNQTNGNQQVQGNVASGATDSGNPVKVGAKYNATLPTLTDGQRGDLQVDTRGALRTILSTTNSTTSIGSRVDNADAVAGSATADNLKVSSRPTVWNGTTWDRMPGDTTGIKIQDGGNSITVDGTVTSNIGTTNGLALDATLTGGTQQTKVTDGTNSGNILKSDNTSAGKNAVMTAQTAYDTSFTTTAAGNFATTDMTNYGSVSVHLTSAGTSSTVIPQWSNDNTNWVGGTFTQINTGIGSATTSTSSGAMVLYTAKHGRYFRINVSGISAGTTAGSLHFSTTPTSYQSVGGSVTATVAAVGATGSAVPASGIYDGYRAATALPTAATAGNLVGAMSDKYGRLVTVQGTVRDLVGMQTTTITASTAETTIVTSAASTFNDLTAITVANTSTTPTRVDFRYSTTGSVIFSLYVPGSDVRGVTFQRPLPQATVNNNWTAQSSVSVTDLRIFAVFDKNA